MKGFIILGELTALESGAVTVLSPWASDLISPVLIFITIRDDGHTLQDSNEGSLRQ